VNPFYRELTGLSPIPRIWDWRLILSKDAVPAARPFLDFMNVRYYFSTPAEGPLDSGLLLDGHDDLDTYESPTVWPRAFFTDRLAVYNDPSELVQLILKGDGRPFAAVQARDLQEEPFEGVSRGLVGRTFNPADGYALSERKTSFTLHAAGPGVAVLSEVFWPGYGHAELNGVPAPVFRVNHAFQGLVIDRAGDYRVTFSYAPRRFGVSVALGAAGIGLLILSAAAGFRLGGSRSPKASIL
jgi:hypothetical protein